MGEAKRKREYAARQPKPAKFSGHWSQLPNPKPCSRGKNPRYCCDPNAWDHIGDDFEDSAFCQGGFIDWFGEPLDPHLCRAAIEHGLDPHDVFDDGDLNYKPHKSWWEEHVTEIVPIIAARIRTTAVVLGAITEQAISHRALHSLADDDVVVCTLPTSCRDLVNVEALTTAFSELHIEPEWVNHVGDADGKLTFLIYQKGSFVSEPAPARVLQ